MNHADTLATADVVVVGAGIAGFCTAWELRKRGFGVALVEQRFAAYGASGRNPGALWLQTRRTGLELDLARAGKSKFGDYLDVLGDVFDYHAAGGLFYFESEEQGSIIDAYVKERQQAGLDIEMVSLKDAASLSPILPDSAIGAAYCKDDAQVDCLAFVSAMESACVRAGVQFFRNTAVLSTSRVGDRVTGVRTVRGEISASGVVWATGAWATTLRAEGIDVPVETARVGQLMMQPVESGESPALHGPRGVYGCGALTDLPSFDPTFFEGPARHGGDEEEGLQFADTAVLNRGGSLYIGNSVDGRGSLNPHISLDATQVMVDLARDRYARYKNFGVTGLWAGLGSETPDDLPIVGSIDGAYVNVGHTWGVASGPVCGEVIAAVVAGESNPFAAGLSPDRPTLGDRV
ncbi:NAD(P)/FAD-dependent oxidoreductase [Nocardioides astragali]|uniref:NAD(P)/FAD-dependent oxidoreductase n=1 Tax=Nocardioides astragali TaxID=1776736 RepID=A0ABW2MWI1_9ACTN|nr:FAD-dependent oxidoreductase [Nocardioides astragali]